MHFKLLAHYCYLLGGVLFGIALRDAIGDVLTPNITFILLLASAALIGTGWWLLRWTRQQMKEEQRLHAIQRAQLREAKEREEKEENA